MAGITDLAGLFNGGGDMDWSKILTILATMPGFKYLDDQASKDFIKPDDAMDKAEGNTAGWRTLLNNARTGETGNATLDTARTNLGT